MFIARIVVICLMLSTLTSCTSAKGRSSLSKTFPERLEYVGVAIAEDDYFVWGSSPVIGEDGKVHLFSARWPADKKGPGWASDCEIARYVADRPEGPFKFVEVVVKGEEGQLSPHNPTITKFEDVSAQLSPCNPTVRKLAGKYVLLYIANDGLKRHPRNQKIYMRVADSVEGPWRKVGKNGLVLDVPTDKEHWCYRSAVGVNNPTIIQHPDGRYFLYYKALPQDGGARRFGVAVSDKVGGPYKHYPKSVTDNYGKHKTIEDGYAFLCDDKFYILSRNYKQQVMPGYDGILWESEDGYAFKAKPGYHDAMEYFPPDVKKKARPIWRRGELERPQVLMIDGQPAYIYLAAGMSLNDKDNSICFVYKVR